MWTEINLREVRALLELSEELHFSRTAERLGLTHARVSQIIRTLETRIGGQLFARTTREVRLTPLGMELASRLRPAYAQLLAALEASATLANETAGSLRVGVTVATNRPSVARTVAIFQREHPECETSIEQVDHWGPYEALRCGEVDVLCQWLAVDEPDLTVGPVIEHCERVLAVGTGHRLASRKTVSIEDLAGETVSRTPKRFPQALSSATQPRRTPSGGPIHRTAEEIESTVQIAALIASGKIVALTSSDAVFYQRNDIVLIPVSDLQWPPLGLVWSTAHENARIRALANVAANQTAPGGRRRAATIGAQTNAYGEHPKQGHGRRSAGAARIELLELRAFLTLAEELHFGRTAERLGVSQSRASQVIRGLEASIGGRLFERTSRRVQLTPLGKQLRAQLEPAYAAIQVAVVQSAMTR